VPVINPARSIEAAVDKYLATAKLHDAGLLVPRTITCQTADDAMAAFAELGGDIVVKPLFGSEGRGIARLNDEALALRAFKMLAQFGAVLYLQEFIRHEGYDLRVLKVGCRYFGMRRSNPDDWRTNVSRGRGHARGTATARIELAERAAAAMVRRWPALICCRRRTDGSVIRSECRACWGPVAGARGRRRQSGAGLC
jgi:ribosomal protein S6--L-glutamate ligase